MDRRIGKGLTSGLRLMMLSKVVGTYLPLFSLNYGWFSGSENKTYHTENMSAGLITLIINNQQFVRLNLQQLNYTTYP